MRNRVRELRKEKKMLQEDLAGKLNVSQQTISRIESGESSLPADILVDLSKYFNTSVDYILYLSDSRRSPEYQTEFDMTTERNYQLCCLYEKLTPQNQTLVCQLIEQLTITQKANAAPAEY